MKTKDQAIASPEAGDQWERGTVRLEIVSWYGWGGIFEQTGKLTDAFVCQSADCAAQFRDWCAGAEYAGGAQ